MVNLYLVDGPLQLLNAIEAKHKFSQKGVRNVIIVRYLKGKLNREQINNCLKLADWDEIIKVKPVLLNFSTFLKIASLINGMKGKIKVKNIFIGGFFYMGFHLFTENLKPEKSFLLDDGNVTLTLFEKIDKGIDSNHIQKNKLLAFIRKIICFIFFLKVPKLLKYNFFTFFESTRNLSVEVVKNNFEFQKGLHSKREFDNETVFFLGGPLVESEIIQLGFFKYAIERINEYYLTRGKKFVYVRHRRETDLGLSIVQSLDIRTLTFQNPIELALVLNTSFPKEISSFYSSALASLGRLNEQLLLSAFYIPSNYIKVENREGIESIYQSYSKMMEVKKMF